VEGGYTSDVGVLIHFHVIQSSRASWVDMGGGPRTRSFRAGVSSRPFWAGLSGRQGLWTAADGRGAQQAWAVNHPAGLCSLGLEVCVWGRG
jgi:hypothetical protein